MITCELVIDLPGTPRPKGSLKCIGARGKTGHQLIEDERKGQKQWRLDVAAAARRLQITADAYQPIGVEVTLTLPRPVSHHRTGRNAHLVRDAAPRAPTSQRTGDVDKLARLILDALQDGGLLVDDAQVVELTARKTYPHSPVPDALGWPGARIRIYPHTDP